MRRFALLVLVVVGFGIAGYAVFFWSPSADTTYYLDARAVSEAELGDEPVAAYENLSAENRRLFDAAVGNGTATLGSDTTPLNARYVEYSGQYYETTVRATGPDDGTGADRLAALGVGALATLVGTFGLVGLWVTSWERGRQEIDAES